MKCVLLTGGAGFIGSHTAVELLKSGYEVVIADDFSNCAADVLDRIDEITGRRADCHAADVADAGAMEQVFSAHAIDAVIHFAGFKAVGEGANRVRTLPWGILASISSK